MNETSMNVVSDILDSFQMNELHELFSEQIDNPSENYINPVINHFQPLYRNYMMLNDMKDDDIEEIKAARSKFLDICILIINMIEEKFNISIDEEYLNDNANDLPGICLALYSFFIIDFYNNVYEIIRNYLEKNLIELYDIFQENILKKDSVTISNRKNLFSEQMSIIVSNIYDITDYIFTLLDDETALENLDEGCIPAIIIKRLYEKAHMTGSFVRVIADIYKTNTALKSKVCFDIIYKIKDGEIKDIFAMLSDDSDKTEDNE